MKTVVKNQYEILEDNNEMLFRTNLNGLITGILRNTHQLDKQIDEDVISECAKAYDVLNALAKKGVKEIYFEDCKANKIVNTVSKTADDFYFQEILDAILLILNDIYLYKDTKLIDILFNDHYMSVLNEYYEGKHTKESFEKALTLD